MGQNRYLNTQLIIINITIIRKQCANIHHHHHHHHVYYELTNRNWTING